MKKLLFESMILSRKPFKVNPFIGLLLALLLFTVLNAFGQETKSQLTTRFDVIRNETAVGGNTKTRIANAYQELADGTISIFPIEAEATSSNTYSGPSIGLDGYNKRIAFVVFDANNTGSATLNLNSIGATQIRKYESGWVVLEADDIIAGKLYRLYNDGTYWQIDLGGSGGGSGSGTVNSGTQYRLGYYATTGTAISEASAITASRALVSDANGVPTHATTTATEIGYVNGVTSSIQTQLNAKADNSDLTTRNNLPVEIHVSNYSLVPADTSRLVLLKDALTTLTIGNFATGVDGSQFVIYNETGATVTIDPSTYITKGPLEILDTTYAYIHFSADTFRISTATEAGGGGGSGTVTSVAVAAGTTGTDVNVSGSPITTSGTITFNIPTASGTNRGALSSTDWTTFNGKQSAITFGTGVQTALGVNIGSAGAPVLFNGALGTPSSGTLTNATGLPISTGVSGLGTGVATWLATPSWTNFNSAITGTAPYWSLANGGTLTGANTITGTTTNTIKAAFSSLGTTQTDGAGLWLQNSTAASSGNQQVSPSITYEGQGWKTTATAGSQSIKFTQYVLPVQGTSVVRGTLVTKVNQNGAGNVGVGWSILHDGSVALGSSNNENTKIYPTTSLTGSTVDSNGAGVFMGYTSGITTAMSSVVLGLSGAGNTFNSTTGTPALTIINGGFAPTSGTATFRALGITSTINQTGGANGQVTAVSPELTITSAVNVTGYDWNPTTPNNISGTHLAFRNTSGQVLINGTSVNASAQLQIDGTTRGFLPPRMTGTQAEAISSPAEGLIVYSTDGSGTTITSKGWWGYDGTNWVKLN